MSKLDEAKAVLQTDTPQVPNTRKSIASRHPGIWWEISAYAVRIISVVVPACVIMYIQNSWIKNSLGIMAIVTIVAVLLILKQPIKAACGYAPGTLASTILILIALLFNAVVEILLVIGISGLVGSMLAIPLHLKYTECKHNEKSPEVLAIEKLIDKLN